MEEPTEYKKLTARTCVKFCRVRKKSILQEMATLGVDFVGIHLINRMSSNDLDDATTLCSYANKLGVRSVLVTKVFDIDLLTHAVAISRAQCLQLHHMWELDAIKALRLRLDKLDKPTTIINLFSPEPNHDQNYTRSILELSDYVIVDHERGGTGHLLPDSFLDWVFETIPREKVIVAGGLTPENVAKIIQVYRPAIVDVQSGVIGDDGEHSPLLMKSFMRAVLSAGR